MKHSWQKKDLRVQTWFFLPQTSKRRSSVEEMGKRWVKNQWGYLTDILSDHTNWYYQQKLMCFKLCSNMLTTGWWINLFERFDANGKPNDCRNDQRFASWTSWKQKVTQPISPVELAQKSKALCLGFCRCDRTPDKWKIMDGWMDGYKISC